jgi:hypothetical protein
MSDQRCCRTDWISVTEDVDYPGVANQPGEWVESGGHWGAVESGK